MNKHLLLLLVVTILMPYRKKSNWESYAIQKNEPKSLHDIGSFKNMGILYADDLVYLFII